MFVYNERGTRVLKGGDLVVRLTAKRKRILEAILVFTKTNKYPPTIRELCEIVGTQSSSTVQGHLQALKLLGLVTWEPKSPRTLQVVSQDVEKISS